MAPKLKRPRSITPTISHRGDHAIGEPSSSQHPSQRAKKLKLLASHIISSPFPDYPLPTPADAAQVYALLASTHPDIDSAIAHRAALLSDDPTTNSARTCGQVANVLDSLIGTILSQNTSSKNSTAAKRNLDAAFGRHNFKAIAEASREAVVQAIKTGGLANKKAGVIQAILKEVYQRHGEYSLQHLSRHTPSDANAKGKMKADDPPCHAAVTDEEAMQELVSYDGVGPKTASCVLLFSLGRASFPVDTHVFRLSRLLGWVPARADRVTAQAHLDLRIPDDLKYALHVLMIEHGRRCKGCKGTSGGKGECVLKRWIRDQKGAKEEQMAETVVKVEDEAVDVAVDHSTDVKSDVS